MLITIHKTIQISHDALPPILNTSDYALRPADDGIFKKETPDAGTTFVLRPIAYSGEQCDLF